MCDPRDLKCPEQAHLQRQRADWLLGAGRRRMGRLLMGVGFFWGDGNVLELDGGDSCTTANTVNTKLYILKG